jgi:hypothetical protein
MQQRNIQRSIPRIEQEARQIARRGEQRVSTALGWLCLVLTGFALLCGGGLWLDARVAWELVEYTASAAPAAQPQADPALSGSGPPGMPGLSPTTPDQPTLSLRERAALTSGASLTMGGAAVLLLLLTGYWWWRAWQAGRAG